MSDLTCLSDSAFVPVDPWIEQGGIVVIVAAVVSLFWGFAFLCEEYCIPSITVLCKRYNISDDVAGAIFIGAGLSLPSVFTSYVGLFLSKATIGVGAVVGGNIFNHLINLAASIIVAPKGCLKLDPLVLTREVIMYLASMLILIWAVKGNIYPSLKVTFDKTTWTRCLNISWFASFILVLGYAVYCLVVIYSPACLSYIHIQEKKPMKFAENRSDVAVEHVAVSIEDIEGNRISSSQNESEMIATNSTPSQSTRVLLDSSAPVSISTAAVPTTDISMPTSNSIPVSAIPSHRFEEIQVTEEAIVPNVNTFAVSYNNHDESIVESDADVDNMFQIPEKIVPKFMFFLTFPFRVLMYLTIPDVRREESANKPILSIISCIIWLAIYSYILVECLSVMANFLHINSAIMGYTIGAWAAAYPALWSSVVVSKCGYIDMSNCNALGSNTFNDFIGLGLPWLTYSIVYGGIPYNLLQDSGVVFSIELLVVALLAYYVLLFLNGWSFKPWMAPLFIAVYIAIVLVLIMYLS